MKITVEQLRGMHACDEDIKRFVALFGAEVIVTEQLCLKHAQDFDWCIPAVGLLRGEALEVYREAVSPTWEAYREAMHPWRGAEWNPGVPIATYVMEEAAFARRAYMRACAVAFARGASSGGTRWYTALVKFGRGKVFPREGIK